MYRESRRRRTMLISISDRRAGGPSEDWHPAVHMGGGMLILAVTDHSLHRQNADDAPGNATTGYPALDRIAPITHYGF
jgi:hypothetical protein